MDWARILAYVTGMVDQELLTRIEYLAAENRILKAQLKGRLKLSDAERATVPTANLKRLTGAPQPRVRSLRPPRNRQPRRRAPRCCRLHRPKCGHGRRNEPPACH
jgi:hypothetical protein